MSSMWTVLPMKCTLRGSADRVCNNHTRQLQGSEALLSETSHIDSLPQLNSRLHVLLPIPDSLISPDIKLPPWSRSASLSRVSEIMTRLFIFMHHAYANIYCVRCLEYADKWPSVVGEGMCLLAGGKDSKWVVTGA